MKVHLLLAAFGTLVLTTPATAQNFDAMAMADTDQDGKVTLAEYSGFRESGWGFFAQGGSSVKIEDLPEMAKPSFKGIVPDAGGLVSHEAYTAATPRLFKGADKDANGTLSSEELNASN